MKRRNLFKGAIASILGLAIVSEAGEKEKAVVPEDWLATVVTADKAKDITEEDWFASEKKRVEVHIFAILSFICTVLRTDEGKLDVVDVRIVLERILLTYVILK